MFDKTCMYNSLRKCVLLFVFILGAGCVQVQPVPVSRGFLDEVGRISANLSPGERVAVSWVYDAKTGDITGLGDQWRDRIETGLRDSGVRVVARQEIGFLIEDAESFGKGADEGRLWANSGADVLVSGSYTLTPKPDGGAAIGLTIKAVRIKEGSLLASINRQDTLGKGWQMLASRVKGNVFHQKIETAVGAGANGPKLKARLDRDPPCYRPGTQAKMTIDTEPGVHLYLLNLAADNSVTLLYPNRLLPDQPLPSGRFVFPPPSIADDLQLVFYPLERGKFCQESIKVVASRRPLAFSYLPVPENQVFTGARGGDMKKMLDTLQNAFGWSEVVVSYGVGESCE